MKLGAIEAGGTKFVLAIGDELGNIEKRVRIETLTPNETMPKIINFFTENKVEAIGLGSFGPVDLDESSKTYGTILETPKTPWRYYPIKKTLEDALLVPVAISTDVNVACFGEVMLGSSKGKDNCLYMTVGTGIGVGAYINKKLLSTVTHPEMGHMFVKKHPNDTFEGICPYHKCCLEGLVSGPAIEARYNKKAIELLDKKEVWELVGYYLAQAIYNISCVIGPSRVILGGGVGSNKIVVEEIKKQFATFNQGYLCNPYFKNLDDFIVNVSLGDDAGIKGCLCYAYHNLEKQI